MEIKWLEDFVSLAKTRSFSRSAVERHVTQSAFSRRIQALETWLGVPLIDRSTYPTTLTNQGRKFRETAEETLRMLYASRLDLRASVNRSSKETISIAALHTLSLRFFPRWLCQIEEYTGVLGTRLLPDEFHNCIQAVAENSYDFLLTFHHPSVVVALEPELYPHLVVEHDSLVAVRSAEHSKPGNIAAPIPLLNYTPGSFLGRVATFAQAQADALPAVITHTNENAMAEGLRFMVLEGHGLAWLPRSLVAKELLEGSLMSIGPEIPMEVRLYRSARRTRAVVESVWSAAHKITRRYQDRGRDPFASQ